MTRLLYCSAAILRLLRVVAVPPAAVFRDPLAAANQS